MGFFSKTITGNESGVYVQDVITICNKHYDANLVKVYENRNRDGSLSSSPFRIHIRTDVIKPELLCDLEKAGLECSRGATCNEWETSLVVSRDDTVAIHPPHMVIDDLNVPAKLETLTPLWYKFLKQTDFLGHLMGTMSNGIEVPKQAFGECSTSIVLETYRRAYGPDYKSHQCRECIDYELGFKEDIVAHNFLKFGEDLNAFVSHFTQAHSEAFTTVSSSPFSYRKDYNDGIKWFDGEGKEVNKKSNGRYTNGYM